MWKLRKITTSHKPWQEDIDNIQRAGMYRRRTLGQIANQELSMNREQLVDWCLSGDTFLDVGCGNGLVVEELNKHKRADPDVITTIMGIDLVPPDKGLGNVIAGRFREFPFADRSIDRALCIYSLGVYAKSEEEARFNIMELGRIMSQGGEVYMTTFLHTGEDKAHLNDYNMDMLVEHFPLIEYLQEAGFRVEIIDRTALHLIKE